MRLTMCAAIMLLLFSACKKDLSLNEGSINAETVSDNALLPLPCHSTSLMSDYPIEAGKQPPFSFTKAFYSDTRVKNISMLSRALPSHSAFKNQMWETKGTFAYSPNKATFTGTRELWEYFKTSAGAGTRKSLGKKNIKLTFNFNSRGHVQTVFDEYGHWDQYSLVYRAVNVLNIVYGHEVIDQNIPAEAFFRVYVTLFSEGIANGYKTYIPSYDQYGNPKDFAVEGGHQYSNVAYTYDYTIPRAGKNYSFIPSQNLISFEYNLCEVMQWLPQPTHQRKSVAGAFYLTNGSKITQSQVYKNYQFDTKGNQTSVTYGDNVQQRTTWYCK